VRFTASVRFHSSSVSVGVGLKHPTPATFARMCTAPYRSRAAAMTPDPEAGSVTSHAVPQALPPLASIAPAVRSALVPSMSAHTTDAPSVANRSAVARPMPPPAPVTTATRPSNRPTLPSP
jgi:hypothetical protein